MIGVGTGIVGGEGSGMAKGFVLEAFGASAALGVPGEVATTFGLFLAMLASALVITHWAAERQPTTLRFFTASRRLSGAQNGLAIAGDYISAASFLGTTGAIALYGHLGLLFAVGFLASYVVFGFWIAEPVHRLGRYSLGDVFAARFPGRSLRFAVAGVQFAISFLYLLPQLVGSGLLLRLLLGLDFRVGVVVIGLIMSVYVAYGGMLATSWVQIIKTILLLFGSLLIALIAVVRLGGWAALAAAGRSSLEPLVPPAGLPLDPPAQAALLFGLLFGTSGLPHILQRMLTVSSVTAARRSVVWAAAVIGVFYLLALVMGLSARGVLSPAALSALAEEGGNLVAPALARAIGGVFLFAFVAALAFQTILAVVTGLVISATTALVHDLYDHVLKGGVADEAVKLRLARASALAVGLAATAASFGVGGDNVAVLISYLFVIAASSLFPALLLLLYWRGLTPGGAVLGLVGGFVLAAVGSGFAYGHSSGGVWVPPAAIAAGFLLTVVGSRLFPGGAAAPWPAFFRAAHGLWPSGKNSGGAAEANSASDGRRSG
ncbi:cation acetate symporter [Hydrogenibacillus sp. N12]|uniref:solute symporter family protein n=1 Tax=Hydrogenibacillus sp. N12 TaxID=2866627 RepID=UPI001C7D9F5A|nr:cation acetate symporter [Hydrogenibacillus sp. N12]QZA32397.1 cation acetate symporter [Hydrogenibacillus sp. N12]